MRKILKIEKASSGDLPGISSLLQDNKLPTDGLDGLLPYLLVIKDKDEIVGCAGVEVYGRLGLVRSVAVRKENQGQGFGTLLVQALLRLAREINLHKVYLLTTTAAGFFQKFGFKVVTRDKVEPVIRQSAEFVSLCPAIAVVMVKDLR